MRAASESSASFSKTPWNSQVRCVRIAMLGSDIGRRVIVSVVFYDDGEDEMNHCGVLLLHG